MRVLSAAKSILAVGFPGAAANAHVRLNVAFLLRGYVDIDTARDLGRRASSAWRVSNGVGEEEWLSLTSRHRPCLARRWCGKVPSGRRGASPSPQATGRATCALRCGPPSAFARRGSSGRTHWASSAGGRSGQSGSRRSGSAGNPRSPARPRSEGDHFCDATKMVFWAVARGAGGLDGTLDGGEEVLYQA